MSNTVTVQPNIMVTWAKLLRPSSPIQITQFCGNLSKVVGQPSQPFLPPSPVLKGWAGNFECYSSVNECMSCISHFVALLGILRRSQMLLNDV